MRRALLWCVLAMAAGAARPAEVCPTSMGSSDCAVVPNQFIVKLKTKLLTGIDLFDNFDLLVVRKLNLIGAYVVRVQPADVEGFLQAAIPVTDYVVPDVKRFPAQSVNDPYLRPDYQCAPPKLKSLQAWAHLGDTMAARPAVVAFLDSGIDSEHPDLQGNLWVNNDARDGVDNDNNGIKDDVHGASWRNSVVSANIGDTIGHGTHVAGVAAAVTNNGIGIAGTAGNAPRIMALKIIHSYEDGVYTTDSDAIEAMRYAAREGATVINLSWGSSCYSKALCDAITSLEEQQILVVAAAGNESSDNDDELTAFYPASFAHDAIVSVMATTCADQITGFTNTGRTSVDIAAPGDGIWSTYPRHLSWLGYEFSSGTSAAAPFVTGAALLLKDGNPKWPIRELKRRILDAADPLNGALKGYCASEGRLDLEKLVKAP